MNLHHDVEDDSRHNAKWKSIDKWWIVVLVSLAVFLLTFSPLLAGVIPYLRAGWPAARTAFWLRTSDPWRARGRAGSFFHLAMAGFLAGVCGFITLALSVMIVTTLNRQPDLTQISIALGTILFGCFCSSVFGWIGTFVAARSGARIFVVSNLFRLCQGDFSRITNLPTHKYRTNPATFVMAVATVSPLLAFWFLFWNGVMPLLIPRIWDKDPAVWVVAAHGGSLLALGVSCIAILAILSKRMIARTPFECWGVAEPNQTVGANTWYQT